MEYSIAEKIEVEEYPVKVDGFQYTDVTFVECWKNKNCHAPDTADYKKILEKFNSCEKRNNGEIDEVWMFGAPYMGFWESNLAGNGAFWYNSPPTEGTRCEKLLPIMGFNYERGVAEMLHDFGHRIESSLVHVYGKWKQDKSNSWNSFSLYDKVSPGNSGCGNTHFPPNGQSDYDYGNTLEVFSDCDDWLNFPYLRGEKKKISCNKWGCDHLGYMRWWLSHIPKAGGMTEGKYNNWWRYVVEYG